MRSEGAALLAGLREGIRNPSHVIKCREKFQKKKLDAREHRSPPGELKPRYQSQVLQLPLSAFLRKHGHKSKKARLANCDEPGSLYNSSGTLLAVHVSRSVASSLYLGKRYPLFKTRLRAVLEQFCSDTAELARLACPLGTIVAPGGCLRHRPVRSNA
jgi:hypothetical protein